MLDQAGRKNLGILVGFDTLMSARWSTGWFTDYLSLYPVAYKLSPEQIQENDTVINELAAKSGCTLPTLFMEEFILLESAWAVSGHTAPNSEWSSAKLAFHKYRANVLDVVVQAYLEGKDLDYTQFSSIEGGQLS